MKIEIHENEKTFGLNMTAETVQDAALLVRFGMNATKKFYSSSSAHKDGVFLGHIVITKHHRAESHIIKRK